MEVIAKQLVKPAVITGTSTVYTAPNSSSVLLTNILLHNVASADLTVEVYVTANGETVDATNRVYTSTLYDGATKNIVELEGLILAPKQLLTFTVSGNTVLSLTGATIQ